MSLTKEEFERIKEERNLSNRFSVVNNIYVTEVGEGYGVVEMDVDEDKMNPIGTIHGGCIFTMCDNAAGTAAVSLGSWVTTVDADIHYLRPTLNKTHLRAESRVIKAGKKIIVCEVNVKDQDGIELAYGIFSFMTLEKTYAEMNK